MNKFVCDNTNAVKQIRNQNQITRLFDRTKPFYEKAGAKKAAKNRRYIENEQNQMFHMHEISFMRMVQ